MDFTPTETEREIARLAARVLQGTRPVNVGAPVPAAERPARGAGPGRAGPGRAGPGRAGHG